MGNFEREDIVRLTAFWTRAQPVVAGFVSSVVPNFHDADDIIQDVAMVLVVKFEEYNSKHSFTQWALGIARNKVLAYYRKQARQNQVLNGYLIEKVASIYEEETQHFGLIHRALEYCIRKIKGRDRRLLEMWYVDQQEITEIAHVMGIANSTIYVILHRIRKALKLCIRRRLAIERQA